MTGSLLLLVLLAAAPVAVLVGAGRLYHWSTAPRRARARESRATTARRPIEQVAADLRRLHARLEYETVPVGPQGLRSRALLAAYDDVLVEAAGLLGVPQALLAAQEGWDREAERLRVEAGLYAAGLDVRS